MTCTEIETLPTDTVVEQLPEQVQKLKGAKAPRLSEEEIKLLLRNILAKPPHREPHGFREAAWENITDLMNKVIKPVKGFSWRQMKATAERKVSELQRYPLVCRCILQTRQ